MGQSFHEQAAGAYTAAKRLTRDLLPLEQQEAELEELRGAIRFITGVDPTAPVVMKGATDLSEPASPILPKARWPRSVRHVAGGCYGYLSNGGD